MKLDAWAAIDSILEAGGKFYRGRYVVLNNNGDLHRDDGPAVISPDGTQEWCRNNTLHRDDGPAIICSDGSQYWYQNGELHRDGGPAALYPDGSQLWYRNGERYQPPNN